MVISYSLALIIVIGLICLINIVGTIVDSKEINNKSIESNEIKLTLK